MPLDLKCPTCGSENTQRLSIMKSQQTFTGSAGQTALAAQVKAPPTPWGFAIGFGAGLAVLVLLLMISDWDRNPLYLVLFVLIWVGTGVWMRRPYEPKFREWERYLDAHFICLRCGALFKPGREVPATGLMSVKFCLSPECGKEISRDAMTCPHCGAAQAPRLASA
jgi:hypothetical protein